MRIAFGAGLQGEEVPLVSLEGLLQFWQEQETREGYDYDDSLRTVQGRGRLVLASGAHQ